MDRETAGIFGLLGGMYLCRPTREAIESWRGVLRRVLPPFLQGLAGVVARINVESPAEMEEVLWDYTRLFIGPYRLPSPPWESVYTSPKRLMKQQACDAVEAFYREAGLKIADPGVMADHIGAELNFVAVMMERATAAAGAAGGLEEAVRRFIASHLANWVPRFARDMEEAAATPLYRELARATKALVMSAAKEAGQE